MLNRLILIFVAVPLLELALLLWVGQRIGLGPTVALVIVTGTAGAALARRQGLRAYMAVQRDLAEGRLPGRALLDGLSILTGGALLLTPGILTDAVGFSLILPKSRRWIQTRFRRLFEQRVRGGAIEFRVFGGEGFSAQGRDAGARPRPDARPRRDAESRQELGTFPHKPGVRG